MFSECCEAMEHYGYRLLDGSIIGIHQHCRRHHLEAMLDHAPLVPGPEAKLVLLSRDEAEMIEIMDR